MSAAAPHLTVDRDRPATNTLVGLQGYHDEGGAIEVAPNGTVVWKYTGVGNVFDVEALGPNRVQIAGADERPDSQCPARYADDDVSGCAYNSVRIVDQRTDEVLWEYGWYDVERHEHELHDVDHYTVDGRGSLGVRRHGQRPGVRHRPERLESSGSGTRTRPTTAPPTSAPRATGRT